jgi:hypothetical protein
MQTNVFLNPYEQPENRLTYSFLCVVEHLSSRSVTELLERIGIAVPFVESHTVELLYGGHEANPDGSVEVNAKQHNRLRIFLENKTWRRALDVEQIKRHMSVHLQNPKDILLVITSNKDDAKTLKALGDNRIRFVTWTEVLNSLETLIASGTDSDPDQFLIRQFTEYLEKSEEVWRAKMIDQKLIATYSKHLNLKNDAEKFVNQGWRLIEGIKDEVHAKFRQSIVSAKMAGHWGRLGAECELTSAPLGQWLFFGIYLDTKDHGIEFKEPFTPEFAVFLDIDPKSRERLATLKGILESATPLERKGFEFNFPLKKGWNPWRLCLRRDPLTEHLNAEPSEICRLFQEWINFLISSEFFRRLSGITEEATT